MSKYDSLWQYLINHGKDTYVLSYEEIREILGFNLDHSFLKYKKELNDYGYTVRKISMKNKTVEFEKVK